MADELLALSLTETAAAIKGGKISSEEVTSACLIRADALGGKLNCIAGLNADAALAAAKATDSKISKGNDLGPLAGVPLAHKDMFYRQGRISGCGSKIRADFIPDQTASVLSRLDAAGALDIARLNMVEFALGVTGHNEITGPVRNPWNMDHITGGSSSGSGASVAAGLVKGALGSDTGGSIRFPAACCGVVGLKPTYGRVSRFGAMPLSYSLDTIGPLTRTVTDNALMFKIIAGFDAGDPTTSGLSVTDPLKTLEDGTEGLRLGVPENYFWDGADAEIRAMLEETVDTYRRLGAQITSVSVPGSIDITNALTSLITSCEGAALHGHWMRERPEDYGRQTLGRLTMGALTPAANYIQALALRDRILSQFMDAAFSTTDALLTPVMMGPVPTIASSDLAGNPGFADFITAMGHCTRPMNYLGLPGLSVPSGFSDNGLPTSFQLIGRPFDEATLYRAARAYERETGCTDKTPAL